MQSDLEADLDLAIGAARAAGSIALRYWRTNLDVHHKSVGQPVTRADIEIDRALRDTLAGRRPEYGWLSEESVDAPDRLARSRVWVVDPIDGTRSFIAGRPEFTISIGVAESGVAVVGVIYNPATSELYWSVRGAGAFAARNGSAPVRVFVREPDGEPALILASRGEIRTGVLGTSAGRWSIEPSGSTAYKLARVGAGNADAFVSRGEKAEWDVCAGGLIVEEAGGRATDLAGAELRYNRPDPRLVGVLAASAGLHAELHEEFGRGVAGRRAAKEE